MDLSGALTISSLQWAWKNTHLRVIAYLILAIRRARVDRRRPATCLIMSRNCARITPGGRIEPENFDRRKWQEHGDVVVTYTPLTIVINLETHTLLSLQTVPAAISSYHCRRHHQLKTKLNFAAMSDTRRVTWFWTLCRFHRLNLNRLDFFRIKYAIILLYWMLHTTECYTNEC